MPASTSFAARAALIPAVALALGATPHASTAPAPRALLAGRVSESELARVLVSADAWHPYPKIDERAAWERVPEPVRTAYVRAAEQALGAPWGSIPATVTLAFVRSGERATYDRTNEERRRRLVDLVMGEVFENRGRFLDEIANGIWAISEQTFWGSTAHLGLQKAGVGLPDAREPVVDLFAAETAGLFAWTDYLLGARLDSVSPRLRERIRYEVDRRVLTPALERDDFWWMGFDARRDVNNWNPWINSNWLESALILERDPARRARVVHKIMRSLDKFIDAYPEDGGCDEGPGYWDRAGASLFDNLELLHAATGGKVDAFGAPVVRNMGRYIYRAYIRDDYFVNTGDAAARLRPDAELVYRYGKRIDDARMTGFGAFLAARRGAYRPGSSTLGRVIPAVLEASEIAAAPAAEPLLGDVWLPDLQLMAARAVPNASKGFYVAAWGGHNAQSHNHNDVGNFVVYADGAPVLIDVGVETYSAKTFSPRRYEIWTMQSAYHNLPTINGVMQKDGAQYRAERVQYAPSRNDVRFSLDIAPAYPAEAQVERWERTVALHRASNEVELAESYALKTFKAPVKLSLMTPLVPETAKPGEVRLRAAEGGRSYVIRYDPAKFTASAEEIPIADARLRPIWGTRLARVVLTGKGSALRDSYRLIVRAAD
jgi:Heparinase II/III-like protein